MNSPVVTVIATCDERDFANYTGAAHAHALRHRAETGHRVMVIETTVTTYAPAEAEQAVTA